MHSFAKSYKRVSYFSTFTNLNPKLLETVCWFYIPLMCFLWHNKLVFIHSITSITSWILLKISKLLCPEFFRFCLNFSQTRTFGGEITPPSSYNTVRLNSLLVVTVTHRSLAIKNHISSKFDSNEFMTCKHQGDVLACRVLPAPPLCIQQSRTHGCRKDFFPMVATNSGFFHGGAQKNIFQGVLTVVKFHFTNSKLRRNFFTTKLTGKYCIKIEDLEESRPPVTPFRRPWSHFGVNWEIYCNVCKEIWFWKNLWTFQTFR